MKSLSCSVTGTCEKSPVKFKMHLPGFVALQSWGGRCRTQIRSGPVTKYATRSTINTSRSAACRAAATTAHTSSRWYGLVPEYATRTTADTSRSAAGRAAAAAAHISSRWNGDRWQWELQWGLLSLWWRC